MSDPNIDPEVVRAASRLYAVSTDDLRLLHKGFSHELDGRHLEKVVFQFLRNGQSMILRLTEERYMERGMIPGEIEWVNYLADHDLNVSRAVGSVREEMVEDVGSAGGDKWTAVCFEKLEGKPIDFEDHRQWNDRLFEEYGRMIGRMHRLSKQFLEQNPPPKRMQWYQQPWFEGVDRYVPDSDSVVRDKLCQLIEEMKSLPKDSESFGLIHGDAHPWNLTLNMGRPGLLDFDYCEYNWFAFDIAIILWYAHLAPIGDMDRVSFARHFLAQFMEGYNRENRFDPYWMSKFPLFLRSRMIAKCILRYPDIISGEANETPRAAFESWKEKIVNDLPYIDMDFSQFAH